MSAERRLLESRRNLLSDPTVQHVNRMEDGLVRSMEIRQP